ncbi:MAG: ChuX/HutX family heme-like substrate-binding protein [Burkholderiaceae bacterium]
MQDTIDTLPADSLYQQFQQLRHERKLRHRDAASELGVSEGEAIAAAVGRCEALAAVRLRGPWPELMARVPTLGRVMALTRNESAVHEKTGQYADLSHQGPVGMALGREIDLRIFYMHWAEVYAVSEPGEAGVQRSLQAFDAWGDAIHKIFLRDESDLAAWMDLVEAFAHPDQSAGVSVRRERPVPVVRPDAEIDREAFHAAWAAMKDTHEFFPLLGKFKLARTQALRMAAPECAWQVELGSAQAMLEAAAVEGLSIMCFVGNPGMIQIHTGPVERIALRGPWLNVLDPGFNLHLRQDHIASVWVVTKPTTDGVVTSLELFDAAGETIAMFFGERKPGQAELAAWRGLALSLPRLA